MIDYYLKFTSEAQANEALTITLIDTVSNIYPNTSTIGVVYKATGALDTEQYRTYPSTPIRVWG
jgi:hypothetical protein